MTKDQLKFIFGRFQNLNLLFLREDLIRGIVARGKWVDYVQKITCPLQHGQPGLCSAEGCDGPKLKNLGFSDWYSIECVGFRFVCWWDEQTWMPGSYEKAYATRLVLEAVNELLDERRADSDAVQEMISNKELVTA